jgi:beta-lactamase class A
MFRALPALTCSALLGLLATASPARAADWPQALLKRIEQIDERTPGRVGVYVKRLRDDKEMNYAGDRPWYLASTVKLPIAIAVLHEVERGRLKLDQTLALEATDKIDGSGDFVWQNAGRTYTVKDTLAAMMLRSDNTAANMLVRVIGDDTLNDVARDAIGRDDVRPLTSFTKIRQDVYAELHPSARDLENIEMVEIAGAKMGPARVQAFTRASGVDVRDLRAKTMDDAYARYYARGDNNATLEGYAEMLEKLVDGKLVNAQHRDMLFKYMKLDDPGEYRLAGGLPLKTPFIHKTGTQFERACHMGVIDPLGDDAIVVTACTEGIDEQAPAERVLRQVGEAVKLTVMADGA